jgi:hydrogenase nickel incorporation protein HypA/HybF
MHELSIVLGIVDIAQSEFERSGATSIDSIELEIGEMSGVEPFAIEFAWPEATRNTVLENTEKIIEYIRGKAECLECKEQFELENLYDECPACKSYFKNIIKGKELRVKALTVS